METASVVYYFAMIFLFFNILLVFLNRKPVKNGPGSVAAAEPNTVRCGLTNI
jgi:hypothetical protein